MNEATPSRICTNPECRSYALDGDESDRCPVCGSPVASADEPTSTASLEMARDRMRGDWDEDGTISVHLPVDVAGRLLAERGWDLAPQGGWIAPGTRWHYWHTSEALTLALIAENA